jgi:hypothetical protein
VKNIIVFLIVILSSFVAIAGTTNVRIYHQSVASPASVQNKQIGVNTTADANLGYKMWFGKDADGNITSFLSKSKPALVTSLRSDSAYTNIDTAKQYRAPLAKFDSSYNTSARIRRGYIDSMLSCDTAYLTSLKTARLYTTSLRLDTIYSIRDTAKIMKADSGNFSKLKVTKTTSDTIVSVYNSTAHIHADSACFGNGIGRGVFDSHGHFQLYGTALEWDDMDQFVLSAAKNIGVTGAPPLNSTGDGFSEFQFGIGDSLDGNIEHGHRFVEGDTLHFHAHWLNANKEAGDKYVKFQIHYKVRNIGDSLTYENTISAQDTIVANTPTLTHHLYEIGEVAMPLIKLGAQIQLSVKRIAASPATNPTSNPFLLQIGIHKKIDCFGSRTELTK